MVDNPYESPTARPAKPKHQTGNTSARMWNYFFTLNYVWAVYFFLQAGISIYSPLHWKIVTTGVSVILLLATLWTLISLNEAWPLKMLRGIVVAPAMFLILFSNIVFCVDPTWPPPRERFSGPEIIAPTSK